MNEGKIIQVMGPVVDVEFDEGELPAIFTALHITNPTIDDTEGNLVVEVAQHLGDKVVRTIAMDTTDGLVRGMAAKNTGNPIMPSPFNVISPRFLQASTQGLQGISWTHLITGMTFFSPIGGGSHP